MRGRWLTASCGFRGQNAGLARFEISTRRAKRGGPAASFWSAGRPLFWPAILVAHGNGLAARNLRTPEDGSLVTCLCRTTGLVPEQTKPSTSFE